jgi:hypothetical protein
MAATTWTIKKFGVLSTALFIGIVGLVWGFLAGILLLAGYARGYLASGDTAIFSSGITGFLLMIAYGFIGGMIGGAVTALVYNRLQGARYGLRVEMDKG